MQAFFSSEGSVALQFLVIFLIILALFLIAALLFVRLSGRGLSIAARPGQRARQPRLGIVDIYELDRQRQLILLRRDNVEHLLLVGGPNDVVVERHIQRGAGSRYAPEGGARADGEPGAADAAEAPRTDPFLDSPKPPTFTMPEVVPAPVPGAQAHAERAPPLDAGLFEPEEPAAESRPRPASPVSRLMRRTLPPLVAPRPEPASERVARPEEAPVAPPPAEPPVMAGRGPRSVDPAVLSDMARQLQVALKRPSSAVTPPPASPAPAPAEPPVAARPDPVAEAMAASPAPAQAPPPASTVPAQAEPAPEAGPERPDPVPPAPAPPPKPAPPPPAEKPAADPRPEPKRPDPAGPAAETAPKGQNPFSVEEIEAEFARLLGRPLDSRN